MCWDLQDPLFQVVSIHLDLAGLAKNTTTGNLEPVVLLITSSKTVFAALMSSSHHDSLKLFHIISIKLYFPKLIFSSAINF